MLPCKFLMLQNYTVWLKTTSNYVLLCLKALSHGKLMFSIGGSFGFGLIAAVSCDISIHS